MKKQGARESSRELWAVLGDSVALLRNSGKVAGGFGRVTFENLRDLVPILC